MQRSDSFILGALLSFSGGLQDAYTFNVRDRVFANAQTGNVGLMPLEYERIANMSVSFACAIQYYGVIVIFAIGAGIGGILSARFGINTIWICCGILLISGLFMIKESI